jgi:hypothetical protein
MPWTALRAESVIAGLERLILWWIQYKAPQAANLKAVQVYAFFRGPVLSMAFQRNLGPDPAVEMEPDAPDQGVTKNLGKVCVPDGNSPLSENVSIA